MQLTYKHKIICSLALITILFQSTFASANNSKKQISKNTEMTSAWLVPNEKSKKLIVAQIGRTLPVKFKLFIGGQIVTTTEAVKLNLEVNSSCTSGTASTLVKTLVDPSIILPSPSPSTDSSEDKISALRVNNGIFKYNWKIDKSLTPGCYYLTAEKGFIKISSPLIKVKSNK